MSISPVKHILQRPENLLSSPPHSPSRFSPLLGQKSGFGLALGSTLPPNTSILHAPACPNTHIDVLKRMVMPGTTFPQIRLELGCKEQCCVNIGNPGPHNPPLQTPTPRPMGFQTALARVFGDDSVNAIDAQALAQLAAMASSYEPTPRTNTQVPDSQPLNLTSSPPVPASPKSSSSALIPYVPESSIPELPMDMGNGKNTEGTGMGDSQHATDPSSSFSNPSLPPPSAPSSSSTKHASAWSSSGATQKNKKQATRSVRFSSPLAAFAPARSAHHSTIPGTSSGNATVSETPPPINLGQLLENEGATPENSGLSQGDLDRPIVVKDLINLMAVLEDGMETKMKEMEERILAAIRVRTQGPPPPIPRQSYPRPQPSPNPPPPAQKANPASVRSPTAPPAQSPSNQTSTAQATKQTWAAITAAGVDTTGFKLVPTRKRKQKPAPGIATAQAPSAPSTPHARQRRLLIRSVEKGRRVGAANIPPTRIRDAINSVCETKFACAEYSRNDDLVLTTIDDVPAEPALRFAAAITKSLNDIGIYGFDLALDIPTLNLVVNSVPLGDDDWKPEDWEINSEKWTELENELSAFNPHIRLADRPKWIKSVSTLRIEDKVKSSIIVAVEANDWVSKECNKPHPFLALYGTKCSFRKYVRKDSSTHCERCLQFGHHAVSCRSPSVCKLCGGQHHTKDHHCQELYCTAGKGKSCSHTVRRCPNCEETSHFAGDRHCPTRIRARSPTTAEKGKAPERAHTPPHD